MPSKSANTGKGRALKVGDNTQMRSVGADMHEVIQVRQKPVARRMRDCLGNLGKLLRNVEIRDLA